MIKGNKLRISGTLRKGEKLFDARKGKFMGEKTRKFIITKKTKFYMSGGEDPTERLSKSKFSRYLRKGSKGMLQFAIGIKVRYKKVVAAYITV